jgi:hypothetical protein
MSSKWRKSSFFDRMKIYSLWFASTQRYRFAKGQTINLGFLGPFIIIKINFLIVNYWCRKYLQLTFPSSPKMKKRSTLISCFRIILTSSKIRTNLSPKSRYIKEIHKNLTIITIEKISILWINKSSPRGALPEQKKINIFMPKVKIHLSLQVFSPFYFLEKSAAELHSQRMKQR